MAISWTLACQQRTIFFSPLRNQHIRTSCGVYSRHREGSRPYGETNYPLFAGGRYGTTDDGRTLFSTTALLEIPTRLTILRGTFWPVSEDNWSDARASWHCPAPTECSPMTFSVAKLWNAACQRPDCPSIPLPK